MAWKAIISDKQITGNTLVATLTFTNGAATFSQTFTTQSQPTETWLDDEAKAVIDNLTNLEAYASTISVDDIVGS